MAFNINPTERLILETFNTVKGRPLSAWQLSELIEREYNYVRQCVWLLTKKKILLKARRGKKVFYYPSPDYIEENED